MSKKTKWLYDTAEYANSRLNGTIVRLNGKPVKISECFEDDSGIAATYRHLSNGASGVSPLEEFDLSPVPLGWAISDREGASYLTRVPKRSDYRQGLRLSNYTSVFGDEHRRVGKVALSNCIIGKYPSFDSVLDEVSNQPAFRPYSRDFALSSKHAPDGVLIMFKWLGAVGNVIKGKGLLAPQFEYLQESFEESMK